MRRLAGITAMTGLMVALPVLADVGSCLRSAADQVRQGIDMDRYKGKACSVRIQLDEHGRFESMSPMTGDAMLCAATGKAVQSVHCDKAPKDAKQRNLPLTVRP